MGFRATLEKLNIKLNGVREVMKKRNAKIIAAVSAIAILLASTVAVVSASTSGVVYIDGKAVCKVDSKSEFNRALAILEKLHVENNVSDRTDKKITCTFTLSSVKKVSADDCAELLYKECLSDYVRAYCISLKGIEIGFCATYSEAEQVVEHFREHIINSVLDKDDTAEFVELTTDFVISSKICRFDRVTEPEKLCRTMLNVDDHDETLDGGDASNRVTAGGAHEFLYADKNFAFGMLKNEAEVELPKYDFSFNLGELNSSIEYKTIVNETYSEIIPFETITVETDTLQIGQTKIDVEGESGIAENVYQIAYVDGVEVSRTLVSSKVITEPTACVKLVGTNKLPTATPTGSFMWPVQEWFVITSEFGVNRNGLDEEGKYHQALDIATDRGTPIYAADGGVVTFAAEYDTYGLLIKITHESGVETRYAHLDRIDVKVGDKVYKGQQIGTMGITGRVTGPHLHFEIRINGKPVNPRTYLPTKMPWK
ncbi:MAG: peptidoglycan DD-metalloendopeptidase family protein [Clostridia bacterium]|nr:peptidoglycan DD-metalloendopeptidase family protein [Clostridia bacterium]